MANKKSDIMDLSPSPLATTCAYAQTWTGLTCDSASYRVHYRECVFSSVNSMLTLQEDISEVMHVGLSGNTGWKVKVSNIEPQIGHVWSRWSYSKSYRAVGTEA